MRKLSIKLNLANNILYNTLFFEVRLFFLLEISQDFYVLSTVQAVASGCKRCHTCINGHVCMCAFRSSVFTGAECMEDNHENDKTVWDTSWIVCLYSDNQYSRSTLLKTNAECNTQSAPLVEGVMERSTQRSNKL